MSRCRRWFYSLLVLAALVHLHSQYDDGPVWLRHNMCNMVCDGRHVSICKLVWQYEARNGCVAEPVLQPFRMEALLAHNEARQNVTQGRVGLPTAANMQVLDYDLQLEYVSLRFANTCLANYTHCTKRGIQERVGQNVAAVDLVDGKPPPMRDVVDLWLKEAKSLKAAGLLKYNKTNGTANFTQLAWADTTFLGCGRSVDVQAKKAFVYCTYWPMGNVANQSVYKQGKPCSACRYCNTRFEGMCNTAFQFPKPSSAVAVPAAGTFAMHLVVCVLILFGVEMLHVTG